MNAKTVWITGAGSGIGAAVTRRFAAEGWTVYASGRNADAIHTLADDAASKGNIVAVPCDVRDEASVDAAWHMIAAASGGVDALVNNAGVTTFTPFLKSRIEDFDAIMATNLRGVFLCTHRALPAMLERGAGTVVMINSVASRDVLANSSVYAASKAALKALTDGLRLEVRGQGLRVISVYPGATNTPIWHEKLREKYAEKMMAADDVADVVHHAVAMPQHVHMEDIYLQPLAGAL